MIDFSSCSATPSTPPLLRQPAVNQYTLSPSIFLKMLKTLAIASLLTTAAVAQVRLP